MASWMHPEKKAVSRLNSDALVTQLPSNSQNFTFRFKTAGYTEYILNERSAAYDDKCKYPCSYRKDFEQLKNDK